MTDKPLNKEPPMKAMKAPKAIKAMKGKKKLNATQAAKTALKAAKKALKDYKERKKAMRIELKRSLEVFDRNIGLLAELLEDRAALLTRVIASRHWRGSVRLA